MVKLIRYEGNPILSPTENWWESANVFNPGATLYQGKVILLYRAKGNDYLSRFGIAESEDGFYFKRFNIPAFEGSSLNPYERLGVEDPRITKFEDCYFIFYTGASVYPINKIDESRAPSLSKKAPWRIRTFLTRTADFKDFSHEEIELHFDSKDAALFPEKIDDKYVLIHRVYPNMYLIYSDDLKHWHHSRQFISPRKDKWDSERVGVGAPPIKTDKGWLVFYHGVDENHNYQLGILLLDLYEPSRVLYRSDKPILEPEKPYEKEGYVSNVVFTCGVVEKDGQYFVYYGAADRVIGLATIDKKELLSTIS